MQTIHKLSIIFSILLLSCTATLLNVPQAKNWSDIFPEVVNSVVKIEIIETETPKGDLTIGHGSGFVISKNGHIVTSAHVALVIMYLNSPKLQVKFNNNKEFTVQAIYVVPKYDIAILKINAKNLDYLKIEDKETKIGQEVLSIGSTGKILNFAATQGIVSNNVDDSIPWLRATSQIYPGFSGGPLINKDGHVVGVNTATSQKHHTISFFVPSSVLLKIIKEDLKSMLPNLLTD